MRQEVDVQAKGAPALVIEVAGASTWRYDTSQEWVRRGWTRGKASPSRQAGQAHG